METAATTVREKVTPALKTRFYSHATLESKDLASSRKFFEEFLGFETVLMSPNDGRAGGSFWARLGGNQVIVVVRGLAADRKGAMPYSNHNGLDVETDADVDAAYEIVQRDAEKWGLHKFTKPSVRHGTYSFYFWDKDDNCWEILSNPAGGYSWGFDLGDQSGMGHLGRNFRRPGSTQVNEK
jgi:catechol 2,3-dioxygenase-like lactoylglutathione lyase family enzyme